MITQEIVEYQDYLANPYLDQEKAFRDDYELMDPKSKIDHQI